MQVRTREFAPDTPRSERGLMHETGADVRPLGGRGYALQLWGPLPWYWAAGLTGSLYASGIRITRGYGRLVDGARWISELELEALDDSDQPVLLDHLEMARRPPAELRTPEPRLTRYHTSLTGKHGGSLYLEVRGSDQLGFLGGLLGRLAALGLAPVELVVDTRGVPVLDRFFLVDERGEVPGPARRRALEILLAQLASPSTSAME